jgi:hypothetical protein
LRFGNSWPGGLYVIHVFADSWVVVKLVNLNQQSTHSATLWRLYCQAQSLTEIQKCLVFDVCLRFRENEIVCYAIHCWRSPVVRNYIHMHRQEILCSCAPGFRPTTWTTTAPLLPLLIPLHHCNFLSIIYNYLVPWPCCSDEENVHLCASESKKVEFEYHISVQSADAWRFRQIHFIFGVFKRLYSIE